MNAFSHKKGSTSDIRILQISDMHLFAQENEQLVGINTQESFAAILDIAKQQSWPPDYIFLTGDLSQDASPIAYKRLAKQLQALNIPCLVLPGNHDSPALLRECFNTPQANYQTFLHTDDWLFVFLNTATPNEEGGTLDAQEIMALEAQLNEHPHKKVLICLHHQIVPVNSAWLDTMAVCNAKLLLDVLAAHKNVKGIIHGHVHQDFASRYNGIPIFSTPSTCFQFKPNNVEFAIDNLAPGYRWLELKENGDINTAVVRLDYIPTNLDQQSAGY